MKSRYLFGASKAAARRLELLARVFRESTREFLLTASARAEIALAIDLGCGPGMTTRLIVETLNCKRVLGLDSSPEFIEMARREASERVEFALHDVGVAPFPCGAADLVFCRFLLTHLSDPNATVEQWATQLERGGLLMIEETETIRTERLVFADYLAIVEAMLAGNSNRLYAGRALAAMRPQSVTLVRSDIRTVPVDDGDAAAMFALNMEAWKDNDFIHSNCSPDEITRLARELKEIAEHRAGVSSIRWEMRQSAFVKD
jgi:SAM-dependent methyltransferase